MAPIQVTLEQASRRFGDEVIIRDLTYRFGPGDAYAVLGPNGSGKSTMIALLAGMLDPTAGTVSYNRGGETMDPEQLYRFVSLAAPYLHLDGVLTLREAFDMHASFKPFRKSVDPAGAIEKLGLHPHRDKALKDLSSGMLQRVRLGLAIFTDTPLLLLDEPCTNLDRENVRLYHELISEHGKDRTLIVASNYREEDVAFCREEHCLHLPGKGSAS